MAERSKSSGKSKPAAKKSSTRKKAATKKPAAGGKKAPAKKAVASKKKAAPGKKAPAKKASPAKATRSKAPATKASRPAGTRKKAPSKRGAISAASVAAGSPINAAEQFGLVEPEQKKLPPVKIGKRDMTEIEKNLHGSREQLAQDVDALTQNNLSHSGREMSGDLSGYGFHMADVATDNFAREMELNIATGETDRLRLVEEAIDRLRDGTFGRCLECGDPVGVPRLKVIPYARLCIGCAEEAERA